MNSRIRRPALIYEYLPAEDIEALAHALLAEYGAAVEAICGPPVPVEAIVDSHLELDLRFADLLDKFGEPGLLGATDASSRTLYVAQDLDPYEHPAMLGRGRFTIAHEVGHWRLHVPKLEAQAAQRSLFEPAEPVPAILCRAPAGKRPREEFQADLFASHLLMPKEMVRTAWREMHGEFVVHDATAEFGEILAVRSRRDGQEPIVRVARELAERFEVSGQAMQIRLSGLGLLKLDCRQMVLA